MEIRSGTQRKCDIESASCKTDGYTTRPWINNNQVVPGKHGCYREHCLTNFSKLAEKAVLVKVAKGRNNDTLVCGFSLHMGLHVQYWAHSEISSQAPLYTDCDKSNDTTTEVLPLPMPQTSTDNCPC